MGWESPGVVLQGQTNVAKLKVLITCFFGPRGLGW